MSVALRRGHSGDKTHLRPRTECGMRLRVEATDRVRRRAKVPVPIAFHLAARTTQGSVQPATSAAVATAAPTRRSVVMGRVRGDHRRRHPAGVSDLHALRPSPRADLVGLARGSDVGRLRRLRLCRVGLLGGNPLRLHAPVGARALRDRSCRRDLRCRRRRCSSRLGSGPGWGRPCRHRLSGRRLLGRRLRRGGFRNCCPSGSGRAGTRTTPRAGCLARAHRLCRCVGRLRLRRCGPLSAWLTTRGRLLGRAFRLSCYTLGTCFEGQRHDSERLLQGVVTGVDRYLYGPVQLPSLWAPRHFRQSASRPSAVHH